MSAQKFPRTIISVRSWPAFHNSQFDSRLEVRFSFQSKSLFIVESTVQGNKEASNTENLM